MVEPVHSSLLPLPTWTLSDVDAILVLSFGGPEGQQDVIPFLENVTHGRGIPRERLEEVAVHYRHFGGISPLNALNREIIGNIIEVLSSRGLEIPVYFGNRNWHPFVNDTAEKMVRDGVRNVAVFATSAWGGYSGCRQYDEDIVRMNHHLEEKELPTLNCLKLRQFFDHPLFIEEMSSVVFQAARELGISALDELQLHQKVVFTAHSIPEVANENSGRKEDGPLYSRQVYEAASLVAKHLGISQERYDVVWQSASGNGQIPWLEPDILDYAKCQHEQGVSEIVVAPIGFISDHMEVVWDLDHELQDLASDLGMSISRAATVGHTDSFATMIVELVEESLGVKPHQNLGTVPSKGCSFNGEPCEVNCCKPVQRPHSAKA
ncbi:ferrochelatase [Corynebacterium diphtheriae]|uniref:ferrochelatase n=1 Tax=Corynebacterium diphtheriae TaxID=1717 RepID=UPI00086E4DDA|nr:ferrochelatase [Corynebacterium diphtheriae]ODS16313.1 ferrochelatase [Corynebacterium diphtheriae]ONF66454.1 ferrochelatase [Corynebacterium diphtheriae]